MKLKSLFITFNIVLFLSFITIFLLPLFILGGNALFEFWTKNWYFSIVFIIILSIVNFCFILNWKVLSFLENEDWPALSQHLETVVFDKKRYGKRQIGLLCDSLLLLGDFASVKKLETVLRTERPRLLASLGVRFAAAGLLSGNYEALYAFSSNVACEKGADSDWLLFYAYFSQHLLKKFEDAAAGFKKLSISAEDPLVATLSAYMIAVVLVRSLSGAEAELSNTALTAKKRIVKTFSRKKWDAYVEEAKAGMHVVVLGKLIDESGTWLFSEA